MEKNQELCELKQNIQSFQEKIKNLDSNVIDLEKKIAEQKSEISR